MPAGIVSILLLWVFSAQAHAANRSLWQAVAVAAEEREITAIAADWAQPNHLLAAGRRNLYESTDAGANWQRRFSLPAQAVIADIAYAPGKPATILIASSQGLYGSFDDGKQWSRILTGLGEEKRNCRVVVFDPQNPSTAFLGTADGLWISRDGGQRWQAAQGIKDARDIVDVAFDPKEPERVHLLTSSAVFSGSLSSGLWEKHPVFAAVAKEPSENDSLPEETETEQPLSAQSIVVHPAQPSTIMVGTSRGIRLSNDSGLSWQWMPSAGLLSPNVSRLLWQANSPLALYAATAQGIARYDENQQQWEMLTAGLADAAMTDLAGQRSRLWAAGKEGLFRYGAEPDFSADPQPSEYQALLSNFVHEPTIAAVREAAVRYAEVHPDKIKWWRRQAALQALLPSVSFGLDRDTSRDIHYDEGTFPNFQIVETEDRNAGLDMSVSWDLGELIWNDDQTSIDTRSKLMVQLRDDIVNEVTRTYFERRRIQVGLIASPPEDEKTLLEKELRVQELTALIDGLTGGFFSAQVATPENKGRL